jgi:hypothetical protein
VVGYIPRRVRFSRVGGNSERNTLGFLHIFSNVIQGHDLQGDSNTNRMMSFLDIYKPLYRRFFELRTIPLNICDEPPGPGPASHNSLLGGGATASSCNQNLVLIFI